MGLIQWIIDWVNRSTPDGWLSLWGSILGFVGIIWTINHTKKQFREDKRIDAKPCLSIKLKSLQNFAYSLGVFVINRSYSGLYSDECIGVEFENLGLGHCLKCKLVEVKLNNKNIEQEVRFIGNIKKGESITNEISFYIYYGDILKDLKNKYYGKNINDYDNDFGGLQNKIREDTKSRIELIVEYCDVLENKYKKSWYLDIFIEFHMKTKNTFLVEDFEFDRIDYEIDENIDKVI